MPIEIPEFHGLARDQVFTLMNCRTLKQYTSMLEGYLSGRCPFCKLNPELNLILRKTSNPVWNLWKNPFPHAHTKLHLVMAPKRHVAPHEPIYSPDFEAMGELFMWAQREFILPGGCFAMRFGPPEFNAGSVLHIHANIVVPDGTGDVHVAICKDAARDAKNVLRMYAFEKMRLGASFEDLQEDEQMLVQSRA